MWKVVLDRPSWLEFPTEVCRGCGRIVLDSEIFYQTGFGGEARYHECGGGRLTLLPPDPPTVDVVVCQERGCDSARPATSQSWHPQGGAYCKINPRVQIVGRETCPKHPAKTQDTP